MKELIKINRTESGEVVSARELHQFLEVETPFRKWIERMFEYGFEENQDYVRSDIFVRGNEAKEYALTLDCAKEISMLQRSDKGKQARKYFIDCEKKLKSNVFSLPKTYSEALMELAQSVEQKEKALLQLSQAKETIEQNKPKVVFADSVVGSSNSILVRQFAKDLCDDDFKIGQNQLFQWLRDNKYLNRDNEPYQNYVSQGLFEVITRSVGSGIDTFTTKTTKITGKGQIYFAKKIKG